MYLKSLKSVEKLNENELKFIKGGTGVSSSRKYDSDSQDCRKDDDYHSKQQVAEPVSDSARVDSIHS